MAYATIDSPKKYFEAKTYTGNGSSQTISGLQFSPDFVWVKLRSGIEWHVLNDSIRGTTKNLYSNSTSAEITESLISSLNSDGFTVQNDLKVNSSGSTYVGWCWDANGSGSSNTSGTITSTVSANTTSGFSVVTRTGTGSVGTVGHGLSAVPSMIITKKRSAVDNWGVYHKSLGATKYLCLNLTDASNTSSSPFNNTEPTSSVFTVGTGSTWNASSATFVDYCFAEVKGFSKAFSYTGNGSTDGTYIHLGFRPAWVLLKRTDSAGYDWLTYDNKRQVEYNVIDDFLKPNLSDAETTGNANQSLDFLSNGIKFRGLGASSNASGGTYIYMAFAENPFVTSKGLPVTAR